MVGKGKLIAFFVFLSLLVSSVALAHSMTREEMYVGGVGPGCTLGYVQEVYGEPMDKKEFADNWIHVVTYIYSENFSVTGRYMTGDDIPEKDINVTGFTLKDNSLATPSGIRVGTPYQEVVQKFGSGDVVHISGKTYYCYTAPHSAVEMSFVVDAKNIITEIRAGTEL